jgi:MoaA/NifB/PqqE/SkfB family radical SAM enzyme
MKKFDLDSHKLHYHFDRVAQFAKSGDCAPIYMEVSPVGLCNHRCVFCAYDYIGYPNRKLDREKFMTFVKDIADAGLKSMLYAGEGEPLVHPNIGEFVAHTKSYGIDVGMFTNGQLLSEKLTQEILPSLTFIRFSFNGGTADNYAKIHEVKTSVFDKVVENIKYACDYRREHGLSVDIGAQFVLLPENIDYLMDAVRTLRLCGVDYISIKPFVQQNEAQHYQMNRQFTLDELHELIESSKKEEADSFKVLFRENAFEKYGERDYCHCNGTTFITVLNSAGELASCLPFWDNPEFVYGNIHEESFEAIWNGERRAKIKNFLENELDVKTCPPNCRPNAINSFLENILSRDIKHINFI